MAKGRVTFKTNFDKAARELDRIADDLPSDLRRDLEPYFDAVVADAKSSTEFKDKSGSLRKGYRKASNRSGKTSNKTKFDSTADYWVYQEFGTKNIRAKEVIQDALKENDGKLRSILRKYGKIRGR